MQGNHTRITRNSFPPIHPHTNATLRTPPLTFPIHPVRKIAFTIYVSSRIRDDGLITPSPGLGKRSRFFQAAESSSLLLPP